MKSTNNELITTQYKVVFPSTLNDHETLFGGIAMQWMDEVAYIQAIRYTKKKMVTVSTDKIQFLKPITSGKIIEIIAKVIKVGSVKLHIQVEIFMEELFTENKQKAITGVFVFAAVNHDNSQLG